MSTASPSADTVPERRTLDDHHVASGCHLHWGGWQFEGGGATAEEIRRRISASLDYEAVVEVCSQTPAQGSNAARCLLKVMICPVLSS